MQRPILIEHGCRVRVPHLNPLNGAKHGSQYRDFPHPLVVLQENELKPAESPDAQLSSYRDDAHYLVHLSLTDSWVSLTVPLP